MPNKKSKSAASKGKAASPAVPTQSTSSDPQAKSNPPPPGPSAGASPLSEDFKAKNARAKALIMSTLVPGSEPWKIAEPLELASEIWKALEEKYAPKDGSGKATGKKGTGGSGDKTDHKGHEHVSSSDFIGDWVEGKPLDKYLDLYKSDILAKAKSDLEKANVKVMPPHTTSQPSDRQPIPDHVLDEMRAALFPNGPPEPPRPRVQAAAPSISAASAASASAPPATSSASPSQWIASPVRHDSYLSESQALAFASYDVERKKQIQVAATKVLMQKLPSRDLRLLWALLYGGEDAPWPGSWSTVIPGVTQAAVQFRDFQV